SPTVSNCIFNGILGNGMANFDGSSPTVSKCTFRGGNRPGMYNEYSSPTVVDCMFVNNLAMENLSGGGMENHYNSNPTVINCTFSGNAAGTYGGGMNNLYSSPTVINCVFSGNHAGLSEPNDDGYGGGMNNLYSSAMVINCTFGGNSSNSSGGGMASFASSTMVSNCIFRGNSDSSGVTESAQIAGSGTVVNYSCIEGLTGALGGTGNIDDNPLLMDVDGLDDIVGTEDDNLRILRGSACVDAGDNTAVPTSVDVDIDRWARFVDDPNTPDTGSGEEAIVDIGAYEYQGRRDLYVDDDAPEDPWPGSAAGSDPLENGTEEHPFDAIQEAIDAAQDGDTIIVAVGTYPEGINFAGKLLTVMSTDPNDAAVVAETIIDGGESSYVVSFGNSEGPGAVLAGFTIIGDGIGIYLHGAFPTIINCTIEMEEGVAMELWHLSEPTLINCTIMGEVNVRPVVRNLRTGQIYDYIQDAIDAATDGDEIVAEEGIYYESIDFKGKEVTVRSSKPDDPNVVAATVISSDGNEIAVTFANGEGPEAILAGFSIIGGPAGIRCEGASPTILHCTIDGIEAGVVLNGGSATILGCAVSSGRTGMRCENTSATITNCEVSGGITGIVFDGGTDTITNCTISSVDVALSCIGTSPTVNGCVIIGGNIGVYCYNAFPVLTNCTIIGYEVAALDLWHMSEPTVTDCNITGAVKSHSTIENLRTGKIYDYIADAVNEASIGDELVAGEGFYEEEGSFASKGVLLRSADPNDPAVVAGTIVMGTLEIEKSFTTGEIVVSGFTFIGGGIRCNRSNPTIKGCTFTGSQIECRGGGSKAYITDCTITDVPVGIKCEEASPTITNCTITDVNTGLYCIMAAPTITNCTIIGSGLFYRNVWYGTVHCYDAYPTFTDCTIVGDPYAVTLHYCSNPTYINCTIEGETQLGTVENLTSGKKYFFFIDNAIRDAESGDEILAGEGIYYENIDFRGKEVKVRSRDPNDPAVVAATVIQGDSNEGVVRFIHEEGPNTLLSGFTITGGRGSDY
ncbi:MAG: right-handed parallel beta-helix repeat-containing protein, partial [Planctomycetota bacterium]